MNLPFFCSKRRIYVNDTLCAYSGNMTFWIHIQNGWQLPQIMDRMRYNHICSSQWVSYAHTFSWAVKYQKGIFSLSIHLTSFIIEFDHTFIGLIIRLLNLQLKTLEPLFLSSYWLGQSLQIFRNIKTLESKLLVKNYFTCIIFFNHANIHIKYVL